MAIFPPAQLHVSKVLILFRFNFTIFGTFLPLFETYAQKYPFNDY